MDQETETAARESYLKFRKNPVANVAGIVIALGLGIMCLYLGIQTACCSLGYLLIGLILFYIPKFFGISSKKILIAVGVAFFIIATVFGALVVSKPFVTDNSDYTQYNSEGFSDVQFIYDSATETMVAYVSYSGTETGTVNIEFCPVGLLSYRYVGISTGAEFIHEMTAVGSGYTATFNVSSKNLYEYRFSIMNGTETKVLSSFSFCREQMSDSDLLRFCFFGNNTIGGNVYNTGLVTILFFIILAFTTWSEKSLEKTRAKMEAEGRLYPKGYGRCKECGSIVLPGETVCRKCGAFIDVPDEIKKVKKVNYVQCSECGKEIPEDANVCPYCGAKFDEEEEVVYVDKKDEVKAAATSVQCSECGKEIPEDANVCPYCGAKFDGEETVVKEKK